MKREDSSLSALRRLPPGAGRFIRFGSVPDQHPAIIPRYREIRRSDAARPVRSAWFPLSFRSAMRCSLNIAIEHCRTPHARFTMIAAPPLFAGLRRMNPISSYALSTARLRASVQRQQQHEKKVMAQTIPRAPTAACRIRPRFPAEAFHKRCFERIGFQREAGHLSCRSITPPRIIPTLRRQTMRPYRKHHAIAVPARHPSYPPEARPLLIASRRSTTTTS